MVALQPGRSLGGERDHFLCAPFFHRPVASFDSRFLGCLSVCSIRVLTVPSLDFPPPSGWAQYNALQTLAYFTTVFVAAPLAIVTGLFQSPAISAKAGSAAGFFNRQASRTVHFCVLLYFLVFLATHITFVMITGAGKNLNHITRGVNVDSAKGVWLFVVGITIIVLLWIAATPFTLRHPRVVQKVGGHVIHWVKAGMEHWNPTSQYTEKDISPFFWANGTCPN